MDNEKNTPKRPINNQPGKEPVPKKGSAFSRGPIGWLFIGLIILTIVPLALFTLLMLAMMAVR